MKEEMALILTYYPCSLLSSKEEKSMEVFDTFKQENANVTMRAWRSIKRVARRFMRRKRKFVVGLVKRVVVLGCALKVKRKVLRSKILNAKGSGNGRHVLLNYDMCSYSKNFDDGRWQQEEVEYYRTRSFAYRFGRQAHSLAL